MIGLKQFTRNLCKSKTNDGLACQKCVYMSTKRNRSYHFKWEFTELIMKFEYYNVLKSAFNNSHVHALILRSLLSL